MSIGLGVCKFEEQWTLQIGPWFPRLPFPVRKEPAEIMDKWGFTLDLFENRCVHLNWGPHTKIVYLPWMYDHCRTEVMLDDGRFVVWERFPRWKKGEPFRENPPPVTMYRQTFDYSYTLRSGEVQHVTATVTVERRTWWWRWFKWFGWPRTSKTSIDVEFSEEVGERRGSWKGGCVVCGWEMRPCERPIHALRRMERERRFT